MSFGHAIVLMDKRMTLFCCPELKSWDDLHKLWYVLLKEKNMLMTQRQMLNAQNLRFPNPERIPKVYLTSSLFCFMQWCSC